MRAFLLDGTQGVILHREVWHALSRFTVTRGAHADFYFLTDIETQLEIEAGSAASTKNAYQELSELLCCRLVSFIIIIEWIRQLSLDWLLLLLIMRLNCVMLQFVAADTAPPALERTEIVDFAQLEPDQAVTFQVVDPTGELAPELDD